MTISIKPTASGSTIEQDGSTILTVDGSGNITPSNQLYPKVPAFLAYANTAQSVSASTYTKIQYNAVEWDTTSDYNTTLFRYTPSVAGYYEFSATVQANSLWTGGHILIRRNGSTNDQDNRHRLNNNPASGDQGVFRGDGMFYMNGTTDFVEAYLFWGNAQTYNGRIDVTTFQGYLVSV